MALIDRHLARGRPALVIVEPDLTVETLVRGGRVNLLPIGAPRQDDLVREQVLPEVRRTIDSLRPGTLMLAQPEALKAPVKPVAILDPDRTLVRLQKLAFNRIRARFSFREVERTPSGLAIVRLVPRTPGR